MTADTLTIAGTIIGTGVALAALNLGAFAWLHADLGHVRDSQTRLEARISAVEKEQARSSELLTRSRPD